MLDKGAITEDEAEQKKARFQAGGDLEYVRQELTIVLE